MNPRETSFDTFTESATRDLQPDGELRLEVRRDLQAGLEAAQLEFQREGYSEEESQARAVASFGAPDRFARDLAMRHRHRMDKRVATHRVLTRFLIPLGVAVALIFIAERTHRAVRISQFQNWSLFYNTRPGYAPAPGIVTDDHAFLFEGDRSRRRSSQQQRAIWEREPDNPAFYGNYVAHLLNEYTSLFYGTRIEELTAALREGMRIDPDNAYYPYLLAALYMDAGADMKSANGSGKRRSQLAIRDPDLLAEALAQLTRARAAPAFNRYHAEIVRLRMEVLPEVQRAEDAWFKYACMANVTTPENNLFRDLFRSLPLYAEILAKEGNRHTAEEALTVWYDFSRKYNRDACSLVDALMNASIIAEAGRSQADQLAEAGRRTESDLLCREMDLLREPFLQWTEKRRSNLLRLNEQAIQKQAGIMAGMVLPSLGVRISDESMEPGRLLDYNLGEQVALTALMAGLAGLMFGALTLYGTARWYLRGRFEPLLLVPPPGRIAGIIGIGILTPLALWIVYTRSGLWSSHTWSFAWLWPRNLSELLLIVVALGALPVFLTARFIRQRCEELGIDCPQPIKPSMAAVFWFTLYMSGLLCLSITPEQFTRLGLLPFIFACSLTVVFIMVYAFIFFEGMLLCRRFGMFYGTLGRSLLPVFATVILILGGLVFPLLVHQETELVRADALMEMAPEGGFTRMEAQVTQKLQTRIEKIFQNLEGVPANQ